MFNLSYICAPFIQVQLMMPDKLSNKFLNVSNLFKQRLSVNGGGKKIC